MTIIFFLLSEFDITLRLYPLFGCQSMHTVKTLIIPSNYFRIYTARLHVLDKSYNYVHASIIQCNNYIIDHDHYNWLQIINLY